MKISTRYQKKSQEHWHIPNIHTSTTQPTALNNPDFSTIEATRSPSARQASAPTANDEVVVVFGDRRHSQGPRREMS